MVSISGRRIVIKGENFVTKFQRQRQGKIMKINDTYVINGGSIINQFDNYMNDLIFRANCQSFFLLKIFLRNGRAFLLKIFSQKIKIIHNSVKSIYFPKTTFLVHLIQLFEFFVVF